MAMNAKGVSGEIRVGGRQAATLSSWTLESFGKGWIVNANVANLDDYWLSMPSPKELRLHMGQKVWMWRGVDVVPLGDTMTITGTGTFRLLDR